MGFVINVVRATLSLFLVISGQTESNLEKTSIKQTFEQIDALKNSVEESFTIIQFSPVMYLILLAPTHNLSMVKRMNYIRSPIFFAPHINKKYDIGNLLLPRSWSSIQVKSFIRVQGDPQIFQFHGYQPMISLYSEEIEMDIRLIMIQS